MLSMYKTILARLKSKSAFERA